MTVEVEPGALEHAAQGCEAAAATVAGVAASLRSQGVPETGRGDTRVAVAALLERFDSALIGLGATLEADADALRASAAGYRRTESGIAVGRP